MRCWFTWRPRLVSFALLFVCEQEDVKARLRRIGWLDLPLNVFLYQEIQRFQIVLHTVGNCEALTRFGCRCRHFCCAAYRSRRH